MDCITFQAGYRRALGAAKSEAFAEHVADCGECDEWAQISCEQAVSVVSKLTYFKAVNALMMDRCEDHFEDCEACAQRDLLSCETFNMAATSLRAQLPWATERSLMRAHENSCPSCKIKEQERILRDHGIDPADFPCPCSARACLHLCDQHEDAFSCPDTLLVRNEDGSFGMPIRDGGPSYRQIDFCPWCGTSLR